MGGQGPRGERGAKGWAWLGASAGPAVREGSQRARVGLINGWFSFWAGAEKQIVRSQRKPPAGIFPGTCVHKASATQRGSRTSVFGATGLTLLASSKDMTAG